MTQSARRLPFFVFVLSLLLALGAMVLLQSVTKAFTHDEHQFVVGGALLARRGLLPYRDYVFFHRPNLVFIDAAITCVTDYPLLGARLLSAAAAWGMIALLFFATARIFQKSPYRWLIAGLAALTTVMHPVFTYTSGYAWNHDLPTLMAMGAFLLVIPRAGKREHLALFAAGALMSAAAFTRVMLIPAAGVLLIIVAWQSPQRWRRTAWFVAGAFVAAVPSLVMLVAYPGGWMHGMIEFPPLSRAYCEAHLNTRGATLAGKLRFLRSLTFSKPGYCAGVIAFFVCCAVGWKSPAHRWARVALLALVAGILVGTAAPSPMFEQYVFELLPFVVLFVVYSLASVQRGAIAVRVIVIACALVIIATNWRPYSRMGDLLHPNRWAPVRVHDVGRQIAALVPRGRIYTLSPTYPIEGGCDVYECHATGPFAARIVPFAKGHAAELLRGADLSRLDEALRGNPPAAFFTGLEREMDEPIIAYAQSHGYVRHPLSTGDLWLPPSSVSP